MDFRKAPNLFSRELICPVLSLAAAILENEKTLGTRLQSNLSGVDFRCQIRGDITGRTSKVRN